MRPVGLKAARKEAERRARKEQKHLERRAHLEKLAGGRLVSAEARCLPSPFYFGVPFEGGIGQETLGYDASAHVALPALHSKIVGVNGRLHDMLASCYLT